MNGRRFSVLGIVVLLVYILASATPDPQATDSIQWKSIGPGGGGNMVSASISCLPSRNSSFI